jgi:precorrin-6A/cobalt-precorrin-6A reductase
MTIWLIGGTQESAELAQAIVHHQLPCIVTVTTSSARSLYPIAPTLQIWIGQLSSETISAFIQAHSVHCIVDASHPFAVDISQLAIDTVQQYQLPYLRYERPQIEHSETNPEEPLQAEAKPASILYLNDFSSLFAENYLAGQRVLLTIGYRPLNLFSSWHDRATLFARILPSTTALRAAIAAGFTNDRLLAIRPPISAALEKALWQQWEISMVVTKASGTAGGENIKRQVAHELGITLIVINRPAIAYPQQTSSINTALTFCTQPNSHLPPPPP